MRMYDMIYKKREGQELTQEEINFFINQYTEGSIPDYQVSAMLMAIYFRGMSKKETYYLTEAMRFSGDVIDLSEIEGIKVDKHSTGGVGDTTTLVVGPLVASCGVPVAKMSGRGLGHTGGTIDKLESIPGFHVELSIEQFIHTVNRVKLAVVGQSGHLAPADKKLYALRDVTATVDNIELIASSIMSKKLAAGSNAIILDVKIGNGAFMKTLDEGIKLAKEMVNIGNYANRETIALLTSMEQPLGNAVGNALEVKEAIDTLNNNGPEDLEELCIHLASYMLLMSKKTNSIDEGIKITTQKLKSGEAFAKFKEFIQAQGGDISVIDDTTKLPQAKYITKIKSISAGYIQGIKTNEIGLAALTLGAGRENKAASIDLSAGLQMHKKIGDQVSIGDTIATIHTNKKESIEQACNMILNALEFSKGSIPKPKLIQAIVSKDEIKIL
ncbi:pyrimidine-nucleoside phosphorylase [Clostridiaceae bacterium 35-E11]